MSNMLLFGKLSNAIFFGIIAVVVVICLILLLKYEQSRKFVLYIVAGIIIISGVICGIGAYKNIKAESYIVGSTNVSNYFIQESYFYNSSSLIFYLNDYAEEDQVYEFTINSVPVKDFNGKEKKYDTYFNDYILFSATYDVGIIKFNIPFEFYSTENELLCSADLKGSIEFFSDKTTLKLSVIGDEEQQFLTKYFDNNGITIKVVENI